MGKGGCSRTHYVTPRMVRIKSERLGWLHFTLVVLIITYGLWAVVWMKKYLQTEVPGGAMRLVSPTGPASPACCLTEAS